MGLIYNRKTKTEYEDKQYGGQYLNFLYNNFIGRVFLKIIILPIFSKLCGLLNGTKISTRKIEKFVKKNNIDISEYEDKKYTSFNDFFVRKKKSITWDENSNALIAPADSKLLVYKIDDKLELRIKNSTYTLNELIGNQKDLLENYKNGNCFVYRLALDDYHRYHFIDDGKMINQYELKGKLHTVSSFSQNKKVYSKNHRICNLIDTKNFENIIWIEVGALLVGKIHNNNMEYFKRGQEKGYFEYGGSTIIIITKDIIKVDDDILANSSRNIETVVKVRRKDWYIKKVKRRCNMLKRLHIYFKERYPIISRLILGFIVFLEIYYIVLLNNGITNFQITIQEFIGGFTVFAFLYWLRVADDLKDYETDKKLFPDRPLPSGRVYKSDIIISCVIINLIAIILNILYMNNLLYLTILYIYGYLMSKWFFQRAKIQPNLVLAVITHNPVQMFINLYIISFTVLKYSIPFISLTTIMALFTLYFPALIWEVSRKIKAPKDENDYTTYSKIFGYKKATVFVLVLTIMDIITNFILVWNLNKISVAILFILVSWMTWKFIQFKKNPERFILVNKVEIYTYLQETTMLLTVVAFLLVGKI